MNSTLVSASARVAEGATAPRHRLRDAALRAYGAVHFPDDKAGWARVNKVGPYFYPHKAECGAGGVTRWQPCRV